MHGYRNLSDIQVGYPRTFLSVIVLHGGKALKPGLFDPLAGWPVNPLCQTCKRAYRQRANRLTGTPPNPMDQSTYYLASEMIYALPSVKN